MQLKSIAKGVKRPFNLKLFKVFTPKTKSKAGSSASSVVIERDSDVKSITVDLPPSRPSDVKEDEQEEKNVVNVQVETTTDSAPQPEVKPKAEEASQPQPTEEPVSVTVAEDTESHSASLEHHAVTEETTRTLVIPTLNIVEPTPASSPIPSPITVEAPSIATAASQEPTTPADLATTSKATTDSNEMDPAKRDAQLPSTPRSESSSPKPAAENDATSEKPSISPAVSKDELEQTDVNPFVIDDAELSPTTDDRPSSPSEAAASPENQSTSSIDLGSSSSPKTPITPRVTDTNAELPPVPVDVNKDVPPSPPEPAPVASTSTSESASASASEFEQEEEQVVVAPQVASNSLFLPIPNTDPLTSLLIKHIPEVTKRPKRDISGEWQHTDFNTLVMTNNWRALARMARDRIVASSPTEIHTILGFWYVRLSSLARMRLFNQCTAECDNLFTALAGIEPPQARQYVFERVLPFELEVIRARCVYWSGDPVGYLDELSALHRRCRVKARQTKNEDDVSMWKERGARMCLIIASQLVEMKDFYAAAALLEPLCAGPSATLALRSAIARIYLQGGYISAAARHFSIVEQDTDADTGTKAMNTILLASANGDWSVAGELAASVLEQESDNVIAANNFAVAMLGQGRVKEAIQKMESILHSSPAAATVAEPFLFNLATLYEMQSSITLDKKRDLLVEVAKWSGDGLKTTCLKMPS